MNRARAAAIPVILALLAACSPPKYAHYTSADRDWQADVPWGWNVMLDRDLPGFAHTAFIGPFDPDFYLGAPTLQIRWYGYGLPHKLLDGELEIYPTVDSYINQTLDIVYGKNRELVAFNERHEQVKGSIAEITVAGRKAKYFTVISPRPAPSWANYGTSLNKEDGKVGILREHAYVVVPMAKGFYVLCYPATKAGYPLYEKRFNEMVHTFTPLTEGPGGPKVSAVETAGDALVKKGR